MQAYIKNIDFSDSQFCYIKYGGPAMTEKKKSKWLAQFSLCMEKETNISIAVCVEETIIIDEHSD